MNAERILQAMKKYIEMQRPDIDTQEVAGIEAAQVLTSSVVVIDFVLYLEEELELEEESLDLDRLGPRITEKITFEALAEEILPYIRP